MKKSKPLRPGFRRPLIPQGSPMKSRLDRRAKERKKKWQKENDQDKKEAPMTSEGPEIHEKN